MNDKYPKGSLKFQNANEMEERLEKVGVSVQWSDKLHGEALDDYLESMKPAFMRKRKAR